MKNIIKIIKKSLPLLLFSNIAKAADGAYLGTSSGVTTVAQFLVNGATAIGVVLFLYGLYGFHGRGQNPNQYTVAFCFSNLIAGTFLLISSQIYAWTVNSFSHDSDWATNSTMLSVSGKLSDDAAAISGTFLGKYISTDTFNTLMGLIYLVGLISFLKGIYLIKEAGQLSGGQGQGGMAPAFWHMVGGCAVMNILQFGCFISWLFGVPYLCAE